MLFSYFWVHRCSNPNFNQLPDESPLEVSLMGVLDGNQSLKRIRRREGLNSETREFASDYYISEGLVDLFKHDVKPKSLRSSKKPVRGGMCVQGRY
jgi:hypothetical protein